MNIVAINLLKLAILIVLFLIGSKISNKLKHHVRVLIYSDANALINQTQNHPIKGFIQYLFNQNTTEKDLLINIMFFVQVALILIGCLTIPYVGNLLVGGNIVSLDLINSSMNGLLLLIIFLVISLVDVIIYKQCNVKSTIVLTSLIAPIFMCLSLMSMVYEYGTFNLHEVVQFQNTKGLLNLNRSGLLISPLFSLLYFASLGYWIKCSTSISLSTSNYLKLFFALFSLKKFLFLMVGVFYFLGGYGPIYSIGLLSREYASLNLIIDALSVLLKYMALDLGVSLFMGGMAIRSNNFYNKEVKIILMPAVLVMMTVMIVMKFLRS